MVTLTAKPTFERLNSEKKQQFIEAAFEEFALHSYQEASLNRLVKKLGIAKGSIYQYFDDKQALYLYLKEYVIARKREFMQSATTTTPDNFWDWLEALFHQGLTFDAQYPIMNRFLYRYSQEKLIPTVAKDMARYDQEAVNFFSSIIKQQQEQGKLKKNLDATVMARLIIQISKTLLEMLAPADSDANPLGSVIQASEAEYTQVLRQLINILQSGMKSN
ncbi:TetR/AcrR family transcriptional regulator [Tunicatimonas pelagia]|uniref:TetR/AcrR family transcriptional regulator n=1 Tax=Tunicatimonas pelagia TaxID=931531 RepID=UPI002666871A|nr:TetR/AcrR family transcriptional regulator [Tunicatimonas pelagia]WKN45056.1 TetR/AcrR family transcriptional regulator [Tunicatimonas pelagia]